jgi:serine/threonine protein kinase/formylglycine-generating enzyme required for sulfatase activity
MASPTDLGQLPSSAWGRLLELVGRFEQAWREAGSADLAAFLPPPEDPLRPAALHELIKTELEIRWRRGLGGELEDYLKKFPELGPAESLPPQLIFEEYRVRQRFGDRPLLNDYRGRFPAQYERVQQLVVEQATDPPGPSSTPPQSPAALGPAVVAANSLLQLGGDYKLIKRLGNGTFAEVWLAEAPGGVRVAIKRLFQPMDAEEARRELDSLEQIKHLHHIYLLQTHAFWLKDNRLHVAMELADGTLRDRLKQCRAESKAGVPLAELIGYFREAAEALDFMHSKRIWHRDVKPENILLLAGHAKVGDFGLARVNASQRLTQTAGAGTPAFMAPEVWRGQAHPTSDQYSLAASYALLRRGRPPFDASSLAELMAAHLQNKPELAPLPEAEQEVLLRALAKDPAQRYASCREFVRALEQAVAPELRKTNPELFLPLPESAPSSAAELFSTLSGESRNVPSWRSGATVPLSPPAAAGPWRRLALAAGLGVLLLGAVAVWVLFRREASPPFTLTRPVPATVRPSRAQQVNIQVQRHQFSGPIRLSFADLPPNVRLAAADVAIPEGVESVPVEFIAAPDAPPGGPFRIRVRAEGNGHTQEIALELTVGEPAHSLPKDWRPAPDAELMEVDKGQFYYDRIDVLWHDVPVRFLLVPKNRGPNLDTFYIMEDKVWVGLYRRLWKDIPVQILLGLAVEVPSQQQYPVFRVPVDQAHRFAQALGGKGGRLPSVEQWDKAAGKHLKKPDQGPFRNYSGGADEIAILREEPLPVGAATQDVSPDPFGRPEKGGCRDMSGNGLEWTRSVFDASGNRRWVPLDNPQELENVFLRGYPYGADGPLLFRYLDRPDDPTHRLGLADYSNPRPNYSFRVVIEP